MSTSLSPVVKRLQFALIAAAVFGSGIVRAAPVDFRTFTVENFPLANTFAEAAWRTTHDGVAAGEVLNSSPTVFLGPDSILNKKITGRVYPTKTVLIDVSSNEDDIFGFMLGMNPDDAANASADYLMLDWKRVTQSFDFVDPEAAAGTFNDLTPAGSAFAGLSLSRVAGIPNADELWQKIDYSESPSGGVTFVAAATNLGATGYNTGLDGFHDVEIWYEADRVRVWVDNNLEFDVTGTFPDGRLGLYEHSQDRGATWENFTIEPLGPAAAPGDFDGDGDVDGADFVVWQTNFPKAENGTLDTGDADGDGDVDGADFVVWQTNFPTTPGGAATPVPELSSFLLAGIGGILALVLGGRKLRN